MFAPFGEIRKAMVIKDRETGQSRGFGFVEMPDPEAAQRAIAELSGKPFQGRTLNASEARPRTPPRPTKASNSPDDLTLAIVNSEVARGIKELTSPLSE